jgi:hypothetical protein
MNTKTVKGVLEVLYSDTRTVMHSILGFFELLSQRQLDAAQREFVEACRHTANRHCRGIESARLILGLVPEERQVLADFGP